MSDDENSAEEFYANIVAELFRTADRELKACPDDQNAALCSAFEELFRRIDFKNNRVVASATYETAIALESLKWTLIAMAFGNYLATRGIFLNDRILGEADH